MPIRNPACIHLDQYDVKDHRNSGCIHKWVMACDVFGSCTTGDVVPGVANCRSCRLYNREEPLKVIIHNGQCPGDVLAITGAVRALHETYPDWFRVSVHTTAQDLWDNSYDIESFDGSPDEVVTIGCEPAVHEAGKRDVHIVEGYAESLGRSLGVSIHVKVIRPHVVLSQDERAAEPVVDGPYWVVNAGFKHDISVKHWGHDNFQSLVDRLRGKVQFVQIGQLASGHAHHPLRGVVNLIGRTTPRELLMIAAQSAGGVGPVTFLQHAMAAFRKPYVCLHGGREPLCWTRYPEQTVLHAVGKLECCRSACWRNAVMPELGVEAERVCKRPLGIVGQQIVPDCMAGISVDTVADAILAYGGAA